ncbi:MAG: HlyC/CorC family transporter [Rhizobiales bacterium]|nr:HlyC/CorC family transporter [Hyphomicrobiales bacterium]
MNEQTHPPAAEAGGEKSASRPGEPPSRSNEGGAERLSLLERLGGLFRYRNGANLREELAEALSESESDAEAFSPGERAMLNNILRLREVRVEDAMIPRADIKAIELSTTLGELIMLFEGSGHSRMPVYAETLDDPRGMVHIRDVLAFITRQARAKKAPRRRKGAPAEATSAPTPAFDLGNVDLSKPLAGLNIIRPVLFVPPSMLASDLMARMQSQRVQMALVIDEYGGTDGLVSLEDLVEMVVGDIEDEHDEEAPLINQTGDGVFVVDAKAEIDDVAEKIGEAFSAGEHGESVDTIGGLLFNALGRVPVRGEVVQAIPGFEFHVLDADPRRVKRVRIVQQSRGERRRRPAAAEASE